MKTNKKIIISVICIILLIAVITLLINSLHEKQHIATNGNHNTVTFCSSDGIILGTEIVKDGSVVSLPHDNLSPAGTVFTGWDKELINIFENTRITAKCIDVSNDDNVVALETVYSKAGNNVSIPLKIMGKVNLCAVDLCITYDETKLKFEKAESVDPAVTIEKEKETGLLYVRFVSSANAEGEADLGNLVFKPTNGESNEIKLQVVVKEMVRLDDKNELISVPYNIVDGKIYVY